MIKYKSMLAGALTLAAVAAPAAAEHWPRHNKSITGEAHQVRPVMSFDSKACLPTAATNSKGKRNGGLGLGGKSNGDCRKSATQGYVRWKCKNHGRDRFCGIVYAYYFLKDQAPHGPLTGHRHDWEHVIMWTKNGNPRFMTISDHKSTREFDLKSDGRGDKYNSNLRNKGGKRYLVRYWATDGGVSTNSLDIRTTSDHNPRETGVHYTSWDQLNRRQQNALSQSYGKAVPRLGNGTFEKYLRAQAPSPRDFKPVL